MVCSMQVPQNSRIPEIQVRQPRQPPQCESEEAEEEEEREGENVCCPPRSIVNAALPAQDTLCIPASFEIWGPYLGISDNNLLFSIGPEESKASAPAFLSLRSIFELCKGLIKSLTFPIQYQIPQ